MKVSPVLDDSDIRRLISKWAVDCGARVEARRVDLGIDRVQLACLTSTSEATVHRIESGKINPRDHVKVAFAVALAVDVHELWPYVTRELAIEQAKAVA